MKQDLNKLSFEELKKSVEELDKKKDTLTKKKVGVWEVGENYVLRTVTMIQVGRLIAVEQDELVLEDAAWVADAGRWKDFLDVGKLNEVEPFPDGKVIVGRHALIDACVWKHKLLREQK
ncbi:hypothetical protein HYU06_01595 [Candidatus Woesearchaeota archaeon]|nr:hypothetical protein [Candidatus Woesearchaeota archaeon]